MTPLCFCSLFATALSFLTSARVSATSFPNTFCDLDNAAVQDNRKCTTEANPNCENCQTTSFCAECDQPSFFKPLFNEALCLDCSEITGCLQCADKQGCQQCEQDLGDPQPNACGIKVCATGTETNNPVASPTATPTLAPVSLEDFYEVIIPQAYGTPFDGSISFEDDFVACLDSFGCYDVETFVNVLGLCDVGANTIIESFESRHNGNLIMLAYDYTICCETSSRGTFFIRARQYDEINAQTGEYIRASFFLRDGSDVDSYEFLLNRVLQ